jgi:hypothetical protein
MLHPLKIRTNEQWFLCDCCAQTKSRKELHCVKLDGPFLHLVNEPMRINHLCNRCIQELETKAIDDCKQVAQVN